MFKLYNATLLIKSADTLKRHIFDQFDKARLALINELNISNSTLSLLFDY
jgi:hypothetical protein